MPDKNRCLLVYFHERDEKTFCLGEETCVTVLLRQGDKNYFNSVLNNSVEEGVLSTSQAVLKLFVQLQKSQLIFFRKNGGLYIIIG